MYSNHISPLHPLLYTFRWCVENKIKTAKKLIHLKLYSVIFANLSYNSIIKDCYSRLTCGFQKVW